MPDWSNIRQRAYDTHIRLRSTFSESPLLPHADKLLEAASEETGIKVSGYPPDDGLLEGALAVLNREFERIYYAQGPSLPPSRRRFILAHEFAHVWLHADIDEDACSEETDNPQSLILPGLDLSGTQTVKGYSPRMRQEVEANLFAAELLLPIPTLRELFTERGWTSSRIAIESGLPEVLVLSQLTQILLPPITHEVSFSFPSTKLDDSQKAAAQVSEGPALVEAGPGTGKTRSLVARAVWLIKRKNIPPDKILALTFSNRAAEEMRTRLHQEIGEQADRIWIGTFHAFGFELLCREGEPFGIPPAPRILDTLEAVTLLMDHLDKLELNKLQYLHQPDFAIPEILSCISRAKDEMITPDEYVRMAEQDFQEAENEKTREKALRTLEAAHCYQFYQNLLMNNGMLDFGDLLMRSAELLNKRRDIKYRYQLQYPHIMVDEYQDMNRASAKLLQMLAGNGKGLWVVGDQRQSIYAFRGASPANIAQFEQDFPGAKRFQLLNNYRSLPDITGLFSAFATNSEAASSSKPLWNSIRKASSEKSILLAKSVDEEAQADGLSAEIRKMNARGVPFCEQAALCRTNRQAEKLAHQLTLRGLPVQHTGGMMQREEVRDLLAALTIAMDSGGSPLLRLAWIPDYNIPIEDVFLIINEAARQNMRFPAAFSLLESDLNLTDVGRLGLQRLRRELNTQNPQEIGLDAWRFLGRFLFERSSYLRPLLKENTPQSLQKLFSASQLLLLAQSHSSTSSSKDASTASKESFLEQMRLLFLHDPDRAIRLPMEGHKIQAVQVMTVHQSKGLEFDAVYLPSLNKNIFPIRARGGLTISPPSKLMTNTEETSDAQSEKQLFFVALSRARERLVLSRIIPDEIDTDVSPFLQQLSGDLIRLGAETAEWRHVTSTISNTCETAPVHHPILSSEKGGVSTPDSYEGNSDQITPRFSASALETWRECGRRFYYEYQIQLPVDQESIYKKYSSLIMESVHDLFSSIEFKSLEVILEALLSQMALNLANASEPYLRVLKTHAESCLNNAWLWRKQGELSGKARSFSLTLPGGIIHTRCDLSEQKDNELILTRFLLKPPRDEDKNDIRLSLLRAAAAEQIPGTTIHVQIGYLATGLILRLAPGRNETQRLNKYTIAMEGVNNGAFTPENETRVCARCPFLIVCPH